MKIDSRDRCIKDLFQSGYYKIPRFQRPYSWDKENIIEFWTDVFIESEKEYFIGSMVVYKEREYYGIVDGQQRLTTITMILCALRNCFRQEGYKDMADGIHALIERSNIDNKPQFVLSTETSYPYFQEKIQKYDNTTFHEKPSEEEMNLFNTFEFINMSINQAVENIKNDNSLSDEKKPGEIRNKLINMRENILGLKLILIELDNEDDAYVIFETLNTRGKDLGVGDLVKNHLAKQIKPKTANVDTLKHQWEKIIKTLDESPADLNIDTFLLHYWLSKHDYTTEKKLYREIRKIVVKDNAQPFLDEISKDAITYREINETSYRRWRIDQIEIRKSLDALSIFKVKQQMPLVLAIMRDYQNGDIKKKHVERLLTIIEKFHFKFTAITSQRSSGGISQMYAIASKKISNTKNIDQKLAAVEELEAKISEKSPTEEEFMLGFKGIICTDKYIKQKRLVRYILEKVHSNYYKDHAPVNYDEMTIEHILPQANIGLKYDLNEKVVGQIGNLLFVPQDINDELKNKKYEDKLKILKKHRYPLDERLKKEKEWDASTINRRTSFLSKILYNN